MPPPSRHGRHPTTNDAKLRGITALLARRSRELERHLPAAVAGDDTGVHQARVASRRLREALPVLAAGLKRGRKARRKVRHVTQALGTVREMDVTVQILDALARKPAIPRDALEDVRGHVLAKRERRRAMMLSRLHELNTAKLARRLDEVAQELDGLEAAAWREALGTRILRRAKRFVKAVEDAGQVYAPYSLHQVRLATKKLRYTLELAADAGIAEARRPVIVLKRLQGTLGRLNDLNVIQRHVAAVAAEPRTSAGRARGFDAIDRTLEEECRHLHGRYTAQVPALLELAAACRTTIVPLVAAAGTRRMLRIERDGRVPTQLARRA